MNSAVLKTHDLAAIELPAHGRRLRVAVVTETWPPEVNGVAMTLHQMLSWLAPRHDVTLFRVRQGEVDCGI